MLGTAGQQGGRLPLLSCQLGLLQPFVPGAARRRRLGGLQWIPPPPPHPLRHREPGGSRVRGSPRRDALVL